MPRYFFNSGDDRYTSDEDGILLPGPDEARSATVVLAGEMLKEIDGTFWDAREWMMVVTDETGATVCTLSVKGSTGDA